MKEKGANWTPEKPIKTKADHDAFLQKILARHTDLPADFLSMGVDEKLPHIRREIERTCVKLEKLRDLMEDLARCDAKWRAALCDRSPGRMN